MRLALPLIATCFLGGALLMTSTAGAQNGMRQAFPVGWSAEAKGLEHHTSRLPLPCSINRITARLKLSNPEKGAQMMPATGLDLVAPGTARETVMLRLEDDNGKPALVLRKYGGAKPADDIRFAVRVAYGQEIPVTIAWSASGEVSASAGGQQNRMTLSAPPAAVEFFVQGGKGDVSEAKFDWQGPANPGCRMPG
jgi:hypothetical protein